MAGGHRAGRQGGSQRRGGRGDGGDAGDGDVVKRIGRGVLPEWVTGRPDFKDVVHERAVGGALFVKRSLEVPPQDRSEADVATLCRWLRRANADFRNFPEPHLKVLARCLGTRHLDPGQPLREEPRTIYAVLSGDLEVVRSSTAASGKQRRERMPAGVFFGFTSWWEVLRKALSKKHEADPEGKSLAELVSAAKEKAYSQAIFSEPPTVKSRAAGAADAADEAAKGSGSAAQQGRRAVKSQSELEAEARRQREIDESKGGRERILRHIPESSKLEGKRFSLVERGEWTPVAADADGDALSLSSGVDLVCLSFDDYEQGWVVGREKETQTIAQFLHKVPVFKNWNLIRLLYIAQRLEMRYVSKGDYVFKQGDAVDGLYFLRSGAARCVKRVRSVQTNRRPVGSRQWEETQTEVQHNLVLKTLEPGDSCGEEALSAVQGRLKCRRDAVVMPLKVVRSLTFGADDPARVAARRQERAKHWDESSLMTLMRVVGPSEVDQDAAVDRLAALVKLTPKVDPRVAASTRPYSVRATENCEVLLMRPVDFKNLNHDGAMAKLREIGDKYPDGSAVAERRLKLKKENDKLRDMLVWTVGKKYADKVAIKSPRDRGDMPGLTMEKLVAESAKEKKHEKETYGDDLFPDSSPEVLEAIKEAKSNIDGTGRDAPPMLNGEPAYNTHVLKAYLRTKGHDVDGKGITGVGEPPGQDGRVVHRRSDMTKLRVRTVNYGTGALAHSPVDRSRLPASGSPGSPRIGRPRVSPPRGRSRSKVFIDHQKTAGPATLALPTPPAVHDGPTRPEIAAAEHPLSGPKARDRDKARAASPKADQLLEHHPSKQRRRSRTEDPAAMEAVRAMPPRLPDARKRERASPRRSPPRGNAKQPAQSKQRHPVEVDELSNAAGAVQTIVSPVRGAAPEHNPMRDSDFRFSQAATRRSRTRHTGLGARVPRNRKSTRSERSGPPFPSLPKSLASASGGAGDYRGEDQADGTFGAMRVAPPPARRRHGPVHPKMRGVSRGSSDTTDAVTPGSPRLDVGGSPDSSMWGSPGKGARRSVPQPRGGRGKKRPLDNPAAAGQVQDWHAGHPLGAAQTNAMWRPQDSRPAHGVGGGDMRTLGDRDTEGLTGLRLREAQRDAALHADNGVASGW